MRAGLTYDEAERAQGEELSRVAAAISAGRSDEEILDRLEGRLHIASVAPGRIDESGRFISVVLASRPSAASLLCQRDDGHERLPAGGQIGARWRSSELPGGGH